MILKYQLKNLGYLAKRQGFLEGRDSGTRLKNKMHFKKPLKNLTPI